LGAAVANEEHVKRLKHGVAKWNAWRASGAKINLSRAGPSWVNLSGANLNGANLSFANLSGADLSGTDLTEADLVGASLLETDLTGADLTSALLEEADLMGAKLTGANLSGSGLNHAGLEETTLIRADLTKADLTSANLRGANMNGANLTEAYLRGTIFGDVDLTSVIGLETCKHEGPSVVDHRTLQKSRPLPLYFLRGVGLPDRLIDYLPSLLNQPIQFYSCFISYSSKDQDFADRIHADLQNNEVRCWFAPHDMKIGGKILDEIDTAIRLRDKVLLILSEHSIRSDWVEDEVSKAFAEERKRGQTVLFPVRLDDAVMDTDESWAVKLRDQRHIGDFRRWNDHGGYKSSFERVLRDLKRATEAEK
jgi:uncharacterized protein YjbI with pentapeptide repeats